MSNGSKEKILGRIREALQLSAPERHLGHHAEAPKSVDSGHAAEPIQREKWLPEVPEDMEARIALFAKNCADLKTDFVPCASLQQAGEVLAGIAEREGWETLALHSSPYFSELLKPLDGLEILDVEQDEDKARLESVDAGVTLCEALVVQTGSILVSSLSSGGRALSVLPPHHVVLAFHGQIVRDVEEAFQRLRKNHPAGLPRYFSLITGPSRTGDIERILVLGAHGPKKLTVLLVEND